MTNRKWSFLTATLAGAIVMVAALAVPSLVGASIGPTGSGPMVFESGTYTPTYHAASSSNVSAITFHDAQWSRVGDVVSVSGRVTITPTAAASTLTSVHFSLPPNAPAAAASSADDAAGVLVGDTQIAPTGTTGFVAMDTTNKLAYTNFYAQTNVFKYYRYMFQYVVK